MSIKSMMKGAGKDISRALANATAIAGIDVANGIFVLKGSFKDLDYKNIAIDSTIMGVATLLTGVVNSLIMTRMKLPHFIGVIESQYSVDIITVLLYLAVEYIYSMLSKTEGKGLMINLFEAISAILLGSYIEAPIMNLLQ